MTKARNIASANPAPTTVSTTELGYVDGVTSAIQTQIDAKLATTLADAKGDLIVATADNVFGRLPVSTSDGDTIVADSLTSTGLRYQGTYAAGKNLIINGFFDCWQRGTTTTSTGYLADRWSALAATNVTFARETLATTSGATYGMGITANNATNYFELAQGLEDATANVLRGNLVTISFDAYVSTGTVSLGILLQKNSTANVVGGAGWSNVVNEGKAVTTTSQRFTTTATLVAGDSTTAGLRVLFYVSDRTNGQKLVISRVQMEVASVATAPSRAGGTIQGELAACQRYYSIGQSISIVQPSADGGGNFRSFNQITMPVTMRTPPTVVVKALVSGTVNKVTSNYYAGLWGGSQADSTGTGSAGDITNNNFMLAGLNSTNKYYDGANWTATAEL